MVSSGGGFHALDADREFGLIPSDHLGNYRTGTVRVPMPGALVCVPILWYSSLTCNAVIIKVPMPYAVHIPAEIHYVQTYPFNHVWSVES